MSFFPIVTGYLRCSLNICTAALKFRHLLPTQYPRIIANIIRKKIRYYTQSNPYCSIGYIMQSDTPVMGILEKHQTYKYNVLVLHEYRNITLSEYSQFVSNTYA
ncbi:hypothetical protein ACB098_07G094100 [Castanea mollissima]